MNTLCICYDLDKPGQDYADLITGIKSFGTWWHYLDSTWLIKTTKTVTEVRDELNKLIDNNDELLVFNVGSNWAGTGFSEKAYAWLKDNWVSG